MITGGEGENINSQQWMFESREEERDALLMAPDQSRVLQDFATVNSTALCTNSLYLVFPLFAFKVQQPQLFRLFAMMLHVYLLKCSIKTSKISILYSVVLIIARIPSSHSSYVSSFTFIHPGNWSLLSFCLFLGPTPFRKVQKLYFSA